MSTRDRARQLHNEMELFRVLVATLMTEVDALVLTPKTVVARESMCWRG